MFDFSKISEVLTDSRDIGPITQLDNRDETLTNGEVHKNERFQRRKFAEITLDTPLRALSRFFEWNSAAVVTEKDKSNNIRPVAVVTKVDLLTWLMKQGKIMT